MMLRQTTFFASLPARRRPVQIVESRRVQINVHGGAEPNEMFAGFSFLGSVHKTSDRICPNAELVSADSTDFAAGMVRWFAVHVWLGVGGIFAACLGGWGRLDRDRLTWRTL